MGWDYRSLETLPALYDIVGCAWPLDEDPSQPGEKVRPCVVLQRKVLEDEDGIKYGTLVLSYGSRKSIAANLARDFFIEQHEYRAVGLREPTRFSMDRIEEFIWGTKWFPPHPYIINRG